MNINHKTIFKKKLLYKSVNRGCKETDLIIGRFANEHLEKMNDEELEEFAVIVELNDADIYDWYTGKVLVPEKHQSGILKKLLAYLPVPAKKL